MWPDGEPWSFERHPTGVVLLRDSKRVVPDVRPLSGGSAPKERRQAGRQAYEVLYRISRLRLGLDRNVLCTPYCGYWIVGAVSPSVRRVKRVRCGLLIIHTTWAESNATPGPSHPPSKPTDTAQCCTVLVRYVVPWCSAAQHNTPALPWCVRPLMDGG